MKLNELEKVVTYYLERWDYLRNDDFKLAACVYQNYAKTREITAHEFLWNHSKYNVPSFESITRCRRKIQEKRPELARYDTTKQEEEYKQYAKGK